MSLYTVGVSNRFDILSGDFSTGTRDVEKPKKQNKEKKAPSDKKVDQQAPGAKKPEQPKTAQKTTAKVDEKPKAAAEKPKGPRTDNNNNRGGFRGEGRSREGEQREGRPEGGRSERGGRGRGEHRGPRGEPREGHTGERPEGRGGRGRGEGRSDRGRGEPRERNLGPRAAQVEGTDAVAPPVEANRAPRRERRDRERREENVTDEKGFFQPKERLYDRRSGTGRPPTEFKKRGAGRGNWGKAGSELDVEEEAPAEATEIPIDPKPAEVEQPKEISDEEAAFLEQQRKQEEEDAKKISYEEYLKIQQSNLADVPLRKPLRKAGEGDDNAKWADYSPLKKGDDADAKVESKKKEKKVNPKSQKVPVQQVLDIKVNVDSPTRQQRNRNPKKRPEQPVKKDSPTPVLNDDKLFPSLSPVVKA